MRLRPALLSLILASGAAGPATAANGWTACWFENGAVVVPAEIGGVAGDWLIDPSAPRTLLHETRAEMEGLPRLFSAPAQVAGRRLAAVEVTVADLDERAPGFATPIAGVIGADLLSRFVVDLDFAPCRLRLSRGRAPSFAAVQSLPVRLVGGIPAVEAAVSDDRRARRGLFALDWSSKAAVRVSSAELRPLREGLDPTLRNRAPARLRALSMGGRLYEEQTAAVAADLDPTLAGSLGADLWSRWRLRLDIAHGRLWLARK